MSSTGNRTGIGAILTARLFYSVNWYNVSPALVPIGHAYGISLAETSLSLSLFLVGAGIFQVPAGIVASRIGARKTALMGLYLMSVAAILTSVSPSFEVLLALRFAVGVGAAMFFSTAIALLNDLATGSLTSVIGYYNASFNLGAGIGIIAFTPVVTLLGWRYDFLISGSLELASAILLNILIRETGVYPEFDFSGLRKRLMNRQIWIIGVGLVGLWSLNYTLPEYFKAFASSVGVGSFAAGAMGGLVPMAGVVGGTVAGMFRRYNPIKLSILLVIAVGISVALMGTASHAEYWGIAVEVGIIATVIISLEYAIVASIEKSSRYMSLNIGLINSIQIGIGSVIPLIFGIIVQGSAGSYTYAWLFLGLFSISTLVFLVGLGRNARIALA